MIGAFSEAKPCSATSPAITAATELWRGRLVDEHEVAGLLDRLEDRVEVERRERARVDHLGLDALAGQLLGRGERPVDHPAGGRRS